MIDYFWSLQVNIAVRQGTAENFGTEHELACYDSGTQLRFNGMK